VLACVLTTAKSETVICAVLVGSEDFAPPLLAVSVSVSVPMGHITEGSAPVAFPQLPLQVSVIGQLSGSDPLPLNVTAAPFALVAFTVCAAPAFAAGMAAVTADKALSRPYPSMLFGTASEIPDSGTAVPVRKFRRFVRAAAGVFTVELESKQGAACRTSAVMAAACGAAAEVPKKVHGVVPVGQGDVPVEGSTPKPPAPVTETPSVAVMSGFMRAAACGVASVGPWLL
jgi:hypothetical protein